MLKSIGKLIKKAAPIALPVLAPGIGSFLAPGSSAFLQSALASGIGAALLGQKPKDALISGILGGAAGSAFPPQTMGAPPIGSSGMPNVDQLAKQASSNIQRGSQGFGGFTGKALTATPKTMSGELLRSINLAGEKEGNLLFRLLNTDLGEGIAAGLIAQALAKDEEETQGEFERRSFGEGGPGGQLGGINFNQGGEAYFPRRNGGIDPSEGSGKKDDVPAMLMAGEFVMTRDAVKGMGDGNLRRGIGRMYDMMDNLEGMA